MKVFKDTCMVMVVTAIVVLSMITGAILTYTAFLM
jgi:hypothetical protein